MGEKERNRIGSAGSANQLRVIDALRVAAPQPKLVQLKRGGCRQFVSTMTDTNATEVVDVVATDPALAATTLKLAR